MAFSSDKDSGDYNTTINVVPLVDVMLVLLIIFMITAPLLTQGINVELPKVSAQPVAADSNEPLVLSVDKEGKFFLNVGDNTESPVDDAAIVERVRNGQESVQPAAEVRAKLGLDGQVHG